MGADAVLFGQIAHIKDALPDSARFNENMSNEQRRRLRQPAVAARHAPHHDRPNVETWTAAKLKDLKRKHEAIYTADSRLGCRSA